MNEKKLIAVVVIVALCLCGTLSLGIVCRSKLNSAARAKDIAILAETLDRNIAKSNELLARREFEPATVGLRELEPKITAMHDASLKQQLQRAMWDIVEAERDYKAKLDQGYSVFQGQFISMAEKDRILAERERQREQAAERERLAEARARVEQTERERERERVPDLQTRLIRYERERLARLAEGKRTQEAEEIWSQHAIVGCMFYTVQGKPKWHSSLGDGFVYKPNAAFLVLSVFVMNHGKKAHMIPSFELVDEDGSEYESSSVGLLPGGWFGVFDTLNPHVHKLANIAFDVPQNRTYRLRGVSQTTDVSECSWWADIMAENSPQQAYITIVTK